MSSMLFSSNSLKMHPSFVGDGHDFFSHELISACESLQVPGSRTLAEVRALLPRREATSREHLPAHITTSSVVLSPAGEDVLLLFHKKIGEWVYPGGHADGDWHLLRSALRECFEETGLPEVEVLPPVKLKNLASALFCPHFFQRFEIKPVGREPAHIHLDAVFVFRALSSGGLSHDPSESEGLRWFSIEDLRAHSLRQSGVVDGLDALTAALCLRAMQSALGA